MHKNTLPQILPKSLTVHLLSYNEEKKQLIFCGARVCHHHKHQPALLRMKRPLLWNTIIQSCVELRPLDGPFAVAPTDPAPGFQAIFNDDLL